MVPAASRKAAPIQADPPCHAPSHVVPIHEYNHDSGSCAVTGDLVEQRVALAAGVPIFSNFCSARIWTLSWNRTTGSPEK